MIVMMIANLSFISAEYVTLCPIVNVFIGAFLWGGQMTAIQGLFLSLISEKVSVHLRATAMGIYFCMLGIAYLFASKIAGRICDACGYQYAFLYSITFSITALCLIKVLLPKKENGDLV